MWQVQATLALVLILALSRVNAAPFYEVTPTDSTQDAIELSPPAADSSTQTFPIHESEREGTTEEGEAEQENTANVLRQFSNITTTFEDGETTGHNAPKFATTNSADNESEPLQATSTTIDDEEFATTVSADSESEPLLATFTAIEDEQPITSSMRTTISTRNDVLANPGTSTSTPTEEESPASMSTPNRWRPSETATPEPTTIDTIPIVVLSSTTRSVASTSPSTIPRTRNHSSEIDTTNIATSTTPTTSAAEESTEEPAKTKEETVTSSTTENSSSSVPLSSSMILFTSNNKEEIGTDITRSSSVPPSSLIHKGSDKSHRRAKEERIKLALIGGGAASAALIAAVVIVLVLVWRKHNQKARAEMSGSKNPTTEKAKRADNTKNRKNSATSKPSSETRTLLGV